MSTQHQPEPVNAAQFNHELETRLVRYCAIDSQSSESSSTVPSTASQWDILRLLQTELTEMGARDVTLTEQGFVIATIPSTLKAQRATPPHPTTHPTIAFLAHVDTAPQFNATGVKPIVHHNYNGKPIVLPDDPTQILDPALYPYLARKVGHDIITASGTTLLGADDKAGVAIIMAMARYLLANPSVPHGDIRICFTPDEEIGMGIRHLDLEQVEADFAYTLDGGEVGKLSFETFSADKASVKVTGVSIHPGYAKDKMVNAMHLAAKIIDLLPHVTRTPETTSGKQGFIHASTLKGGSAEVEIGFILRDYELEGLAAHGELLKQVCATVQATEPRARIECTITKQYRNMRYWLEKETRPVDRAVDAMRLAQIEPIYDAVRGGTDGSQLTERGLPTPNLFTGMQNIHGPLEWISVQDMAQTTVVCLYLAQLWAGNQ